MLPLSFKTMMVAELKTPYTSCAAHLELRGRHHTRGFIITFLTLQQGRVLSDPSTNTWRWWHLEMDFSLLRFCSWLYHKQC